MDCHPLVYMCFIHNVFHDENAFKKVHFLISASFGCTVFNYVRRTFETLHDKFLHQTEENHSLCITMPLILHVAD